MWFGNSVVVLANCVNQAITLCQNTLYEHSNCILHDQLIPPMVFLFPSVFLGKMITRPSSVKNIYSIHFSGVLLTSELFSKTSLGTLWIIVFVRDMRNSRESEDLFCSKPSMMYMKDRARLLSHMMVSCQKDAVYVGRIQEYDSFAPSIWANP